MSEKERKERIAELLSEPKDLQSTPRSDWHKAFEALLRLKTYKYHGISIHVEVPIGTDVPGTDFMILTGREKPDFDEDILKSSGR